jgi:hypothetical protein
MTMKSFEEELAILNGRIAERVHTLGRYTGKIPAIEIDLMLEDIRRLYDCVQLIRNLQGGIIPETPPAVKEPEILKEVKPAEVIIESQPEVKKPEPAVEVVVMEVKEVNEPEKGTTEVPAVVEEPERIETVTKKSVMEEGPRVSSSSEEHSQPAAKKILGETLVTGGTHSINDLIAARFSDHSIAGRMQQHPISNLKASIGINEKFIFVYELFGGNMQIYSEVIEKLNTMPGRNEAIALMEELRSEYHWDIENMAFQKLIDMVTRRYS